MKVILNTDRTEGPHRVTVTGAARLILIRRHFVWSIISINTGLTVDSHGVLQAVCANPSSSELSSSIQTLLLLCNTFIIVTVFGFIVTITCFTCIARGHGSRPPGPLMVPRTAPVTALPASIMLTLTLQFLCSFIPWTATSMTIADTHASNRNVLY